MFAKYFVAATAVLSLASAAATPIEEDWTLTLLKRQEPGTPAYACHEDCGNAITLSRGASPCTNDDFLSQYQSCLECSGPASFNIWRYYGNTLGAAGTKCGLATTPGSGGAVTTTSSAVVSAPETPTAAPETTPAAEETTPAAEETTSAAQEEATSSAPETAQTSSPVSGSTAAETSVSSPSYAASSGSTASPSTTYAGTAQPTGSTTNSTLPASFTGAANSGRGDVVAGLGMMAAALAFVF